MKCINLKILFIILSILMVGQGTYASSVISSKIDLLPHNDNSEVNTTDFIHTRYDDGVLALLNDNTILYDEIDDLVHKFNPNVLSWWNSYEGNKDSTEVYDGYMEAYDNLVSAADSSDNDVMSSRLYAQANAMKVLADNNVNDSTINFWKYQIDEIKLWLATKKKYLNYYISYYRSLLASENVKYQDDLMETSKVRFEVGLDTEIAYLTSVKNYDDAKANFELANTNVEVALKDIKVSCGKSTGDDILIGAEPAFDVNKIFDINLETDIQNAINNNLSLRSYNRALHNANSEETKKHYQILVDYGRDAVANSVKSLYNSYQNASMNYATLLSNFDLIKTQVDKSQVDFDNGRISSAEYNASKFSLKNAELNLAIQKLNVISMYEDYKYAVEMGIANALLQ